MCWEVQEISCSTVSLQSSYLSWHRKEYYLQVLRKRLELSWPMLRMRYGNRWRLLRPSVKKVLQIRYLCRSSHHIQWSSSSKVLFPLSGSWSWLRSTIRCHLLLACRSFHLLHHRHLNGKSRQEIHSAPHYSKQTSSSLSYRPCAGLHPQKVFPDK